MIACEVTKREDTGRPCTADGTSIATLVYPNGVRETKRCCAHHRVAIEAASAETMRAIEKRDADRRAEADARRSRLTERAERGQARSQGLPVTIPPPPSRTRKPTMPTVDESQLAPLPLPNSLKGLRPSCRWPGCEGKGPGRPLCAATHRNRLLSMSKDGDVPRDFDPETCDPAEFTKRWADRQARIENERKAKRGPALPAIVAVTDEPALPVKTYPLGPFLADVGEGGPKYPDAVGFSEGADVTWLSTAGEPGEPPPPMSEVDALRGWAERAEAAIGKMEIERDAAMDARELEADNRAREVGMLRDEIANRDAQIAALRNEEGAAHLSLDAAQVPSGLPLDQRITKLANLAREGRDRNAALTTAVLDVAKERDEAVAAISSARADSAELAALLAFMRNGGTADVSGATFVALAAYDDRRNIRSRDPERRPAYDVPRMISVAEYAVGQLLDLIADEAGRECAPSPEVIRALRALTLGRVPEAA